MAVTDYTELKAAVADWLLRTDLTSVIPDFITHAENALRRDPRVRRLVTTTLPVDAQDESLPTDFVQLESLYLDGDTYFGEIDVVSAGMLGDIERNFGQTGVPMAAAILDQSVMRFAPVPDATYTFKMTYWETVPHLSGSLLSNWLLDDHSDIYLYASLIESAPYLRDDQRIALWRSELERRLMELDRNIKRGQYSGSLIRRSANPIP